MYMYKIFTSFNKTFWDGSPCVVIKRRLLNYTTSFDLWKHVLGVDNFLSNPSIVVQFCDVPLFRKLWRVAERNISGPNWGLDDVNKRCSYEKKRFPIDKRIETCIRNRKAHVSQQGANPTNSSVHVEREERKNRDGEREHRTMYVCSKINRL